MENNSDINKIHSVNFSQIKSKKSLKLLFSELRKLRKLPKFDLIIDMQGLLKSAIVAKIIPANQTIGFDKNSIREPLAAKFYSDTCKIDYAQNIVKRNLALVCEALEIKITAAEIENKKPFLHFKKHTFKLAKTKQNIAIIPGASSAAKIYPAEKYAQIANILDANFMIIWGNQAEKMMAEKIQQTAPEVHISKQLALDELKALLAKMDLVIGADTGPVHLAWALNVPSITLFGPTPGSRNAYAGEINKILQSESAVNPYKINKNDDSIKSIPVENIAKIAKKLLKNI
ncbi:MAG: lipopolysaccharide heptosyltransferase I [Candidatus Thioglobus sp.]|nr:lipopolysaccharide heptosyltransferase I [Candidatus Thioglobus sp.]